MRYLHLPPAHMCRLSPTPLSPPLMVLASSTACCSVAVGVSTSTCWAEQECRHQVSRRSPFRYRPSAPARRRGYGWGRTLFPASDREQFDVAATGPEGVVCWV